METLEKKTTPSSEETNQPKTTTPDTKEQQPKNPNRRDEDPETTPANPNPWKNPDPTKPEKINTPYAGNEEDTSDEDETENEDEDVDTGSAEENTKTTTNKPGYNDTEERNTNTPNSDVEGAASQKNYREEE